MHTDVRCALGLEVLLFLFSVLSMEFHNFHRILL